MFFEQAREQAEKDFSSNSRDAQVNTRSDAPCDAASPQPCHTAASGAAHPVVQRLGPALANNASSLAHFCRQALTRWGGALLELAHFRQGEDAYRMIEQVHPSAPQSQQLVCVAAMNSTLCVCMLHAPAE